MKIHVNGTPYNIKNIGERVWLDNNEITIKLSEDKIIIKGNTFYIDFIEHGDPSLVILNGMAYMVSKDSKDRINKGAKDPYERQDNRRLPEKWN